MKSVLIKEIKQNRGVPRVWLQGPRLENAGFIGGKRYAIDCNGQTLKLTVDDSGTRMVTMKDSGTSKGPVIDLNSSKMLSLFDGMQKVRIIFETNRIYIMPLASEVRKRQRLERLREKIKNGLKLTVGSLSHGGGILSRAIHEGLEKKGIASRCGFAVEVREELLEQSARCNPGWTEESQFISAPIQEIAYDEWAMKYIENVDILEAGLPCSGASIAGRSKNKISMPEAHPLVGHLLVGALAIIARVNPSVIILENVVPYSESASAAIIRTQLQDMGYRLHERVLSGEEFNALEHRVRWCMVAVTEGMDFDFSQLEVPVRRQRQLSEVLEHMEQDDPRWRPYTYLIEKQERDKEQGKGFMMQVLGPEAASVGTIGKGYAKVRSTEIKVKHPTDSTLMRQLTPAEHARVKGIPEDTIAEVSETIAHEILGQSINYEPFVAVGELAARYIMSFVFGEPIAAPVEEVREEPVEQPYGQLAFLGV